MGVTHGSAHISRVGMRKKEFCINVCMQVVSFALSPLFFSHSIMTEQGEATKAKIDMISLHECKQCRSFG